MDKGDSGNTICELVLAVDTITHEVIYLMMPEFAAIFCSTNQRLVQGWIRRVCKLVFYTRLLLRETEHPCVCSENNYFDSGKQLCRFLKTVMSVLLNNYISARKQLCQFWKTSIWVPENNYADSIKLLCRFWKTTRSIMENNDVDSGKNQASRTELIYQHIKQNKINRLVPAGCWPTKNAAKITKQTGSGMRNDNITNRIG